MKFTLKEHVAAPPEEVFRVASDLARAPELIPSIRRLELLTDGPVGKGTRFCETRVMFGKEATEEMEVTAFDPPRGYVVACESHGCRYRSEWSFTPASGGTDVEMTFEAEPLTFAAKLMGFLFAPMMKACAKEIAKDLTDLRQAIESGVAAGAPSGAEGA